MKTEKLTTLTLETLSFGLLNFKNARRIAFSIFGLTILLLMSVGTIQAQQFCNSTSITIPSSGAANPYPSNITVSGLTGVTTDVTVTLNNIQHTFAEDIDILLVSPTGQKFIILSNVGGDAGFDTAATITLSDAATANLPTDSAVIASGTYKPTNSGTGDTFPPPAPAAPYGNPAPAGTETFDSVFGSTNPNGVWSLYVVDGAGGDSGSISGGWCLTITTAAPTPGQLQFAASDFNTGETDGTATITVNRTNGFSGSVTVDYATSDGTATGGASCTAGVDYINTSGTLTFPNGVVSQTFSVPICSDAESEPDETVNLTLSNPTGGATLGTPSAATLMIQAIRRESAKLTGTDSAAFDHFGNSIAVSGNTAIVGAEQDSTGNTTRHGSAYILIRNGAGWTEQQKLTAPTLFTDDFFGVSVAISGDTAIVGASGTSSFKGAAYIFTRSGTVWSLQQKLTASDGAAGDIFGFSVAVEGDTAVVGAFGANADQGAAYIFTRNGTTWSQQQKLTASDGGADDLFGRSLAISGDTLVIGADGADIGANADQGAAYIFTRSGANWMQQQKLTASDGDADDLFGISLAISGDTLVIGAPCGNICSNNPGAAYVFTRSGAVWNEQQKITASDGATDDNFGIAVAIEDNTIIIGADLDDIGANSNQGSAYVFTRSNITWTEQLQLLASDGAAADHFGNSAAITNGTFIVGAELDDFDGARNQGSIYIFNPPLAPTAANVSISGRVLTDRGRGLRNAFVVMTDQNGSIRTARTSAFGYYRFEDVAAGETYIMSVQSKRYYFTPQVISATENLTGLNFTAYPKFSQVLLR